MLPAGSLRGCFTLTASSPVEGEEIGPAGVKPQYAMTLRGTQGVQRGKAPLPRVWGCPPIPLVYPPRVGAGGLQGTLDGVGLRPGFPVPRE